MGYKTLLLASCISPHVEQRFSRWVARDGRGDKDCWEWEGACMPFGYGVFCMASQSGKWQSYRAHRVAYVIANGDPEEGLVVMHLCDNPRCVNPTHLRAGTQRENMMMMRARGRGTHGDTHPGLKVTSVSAKEMARMREKNIPMREIGASFGVSPATVCRVLKRHDKVAHAAP